MRPPCQIKKVENLPYKFSANDVQKNAVQHYSRKSNVEEDSIDQWIRGLNGGKQENNVDAIQKEQYKHVKDGDANSDDISSENPDDLDISDQYNYKSNGIYYT